MKKKNSVKTITILLICMLLFGCTSKFKKGDYLYLAINNSNVNKMDKYLPTKISFYYSNMVAWTNFEDAKDIEGFVKYFKEIRIEEEAEPINEVNFSCAFFFGDERFAINANNDIVKLDLENGKTVYYKVSGIEELNEYIEAKSISSYGYGEEKERIVLNYGDMTIYQKAIEKNDDEDFIIRFNVSNQSNKIYSFIINPIVNDHRVHSYEAYKIEPNQTKNIEETIPTSVFNKYGISTIGKIQYTIDVFECDADTKEEISLLTSSDLIDALETNDQYPNEVVANEDSLVYLNSGIKFYSILMENGMDSSIYVYIVNENEEHADIYYTGSVLNGEPFVTSVNPRAYSIEVGPKSDVLARIPMLNYSIDPETKIVNVIDINTLSMTFDLVFENGTVLTEQKMILK